MENEQRSSLKLRLPSHVKAWIEREAAQNGCSQNAEIIRSIRMRMPIEAETAGASAKSTPAV